MSRSPFRVGRFLLPGLVAIGLFGVFAVTFAVAGLDFGPSEGFPDGVSITEELGLALVDAAALTDGGLAALILFALVLDAALDGAVYLARREEGDQQ